MAVWAVLNQKGGVGKTTIAINLADAIARHCNSIDEQGEAGEAWVALIDADPQGSSAAWGSAYKGAHVDVHRVEDHRQLANRVKELALTHDYIIIDGPPQVAEIAAAVIKLADFVLIPCTPSPLDVWAARDLVDLVKERQRHYQGTPGAAFVVSREVQGTQLASQIRTTLAGYGLPVLQAGTINRVAYPGSIAAGSTVFESTDTSKAANEILAIMRECLTLTGAHDYEPTEVAV